MGKAIGEISVIQRYATKDGPGIRSTVFFRGCNLICKWCANPELLSSEKKILSFENKCRRCGACIEACPQHAITMGGKAAVINREKCIVCGTCVEVCPYDAYELLGTQVTPEELCEKLVRDKDFYDHSGGGVTFSGGEAALQGEFIIETSKLLRDRGIATALDTAGHLAWEKLMPVVQAVDLVLYDVKAIDTQVHERYTGVANGLILENAKRIAEMGKDMIIRMIVVNGINDSPEEIENRLAFIKALGQSVIKVDILNYHNLGEGKYKSLGMPYGLAGTLPCPDETMQHILKRAKELGLPAVIES